ncbi:hypothetical protein FNV43_RR18566 [Rhamnella rubrinervis]|uniref:YEATS domain-containing protein n=1 Tax=Rhamnella rubrinervis TaxID=2594499 RepID=A0A8K0DZ79_9ROSA|nr:hypothetical protein FNV43_RR18566 [Rhamnella rubrinervis]
MSARKIGETQGDDFVSAPVVQPIRITKSAEDSDKKGANRRLKDTEICVPIVYGTIAFYLGRKASESQSHKWTVYVRGATNEDLGAVIKRVVFQLHPSFNNPTRVVESAPFELSECGWGEFEIAISLFFHSDICDKQLDLYHHLKLYPEDESGPQSTKKPVVMESYNEIVFPDPLESFFARVQNHPAVIVPRLPAGFTLPNPGDTKDHPLSQWFTTFSEADELLKLAAARQQVQAHIVKLKRQLSVMDGPPQLSKPPSGYESSLLPWHLGNLALEVGVLFFFSYVHNCEKIPFPEELWIIASLAVLVTTAVHVVLFMMYKATQHKNHTFYWGSLRMKDHLMCNDKCFQEEILIQNWRGWFEVVELLKLKCHQEVDDAVQPLPLSFFQVLSRQE